MPQTRNEVYPGQPAITLPLLLLLLLHVSSFCYDFVFVLVLVFPLPTKRMIMFGFLGLAKYQMDIGQLQRTLNRYEKASKFNFKLLPVAKRIFA